MSGEKHQLLRRDLEADLAQRIVLVAIALADPLEGDHVPSVAIEERADEVVRDEGPQVIGTLTDTDESDRQAEAPRNGEDHTALGSTVELGQRDSRDASASSLRSTRTTLASSSMRWLLLDRRPAVSAISTSVPRLVAACRAS